MKKTNKQKIREYKDTATLVELSRIYYQLQENIINKNVANDMLKETYKELTELDELSENEINEIELNSFELQESDSLEIINLKTEIKQKENLIIELFKELETLKENLNNKQNNLNLFDNDNDNE